MDDTKKYVIVAEDDKAYAKVFENKLVRAGLEVTVVGDGQEALEALRERKPDVLILDLMMPTMDGFTVLKEIKADPKLQDINVIVATNLSQDVDIKKALEAGAIDYFVKSDISIADMLKKVISHVQ